MEFRDNPGCFTLPEDLMDARDFLAAEAIDIDESIELPKSFSLGKRIRTTNYQNGWGSCTANSTSHGVQVLAVEKKKIVPIKDNLVTPDWKDLWTKMGHNLDDKNDSGDYVEKAVNTALKQGIKTLEGIIVQFDGYAYGNWSLDMNRITRMKRYLYKGCPIVRCMRGNQTTRNELQKGQLKTLIPVENRTGGHAICLVGRDEGGLRFVNSWKTNDGEGRKSRFYVTYKDMIRLGSMFNWRYWIVYNKEDAKLDPEYLKRKNQALMVIQEMKKLYHLETPETQNLIESLSKALRKSYPEINEELPI